MRGWGLFKTPCMCPDCQRARVKARDGVDVAAPPPVPQGLYSSPVRGVMPAPPHEHRTPAAPGAGAEKAAAPVVSAQPTQVGARALRPWLTTSARPRKVKAKPVMTASNGVDNVARPPQVASVECESCQIPGGAVMASGPVMMTANAPGYAVVGGEQPAPGYAVVGGTVPVAEPAPIGVMQVRPAVAAASRRGPTDPSVTPSAFAQDTITNPAAGRPHVLTHLFNLDMIGRRSAEERERREREGHASIPYGPMNEPVNDLPASVVYGKGR